MPSLAYKHISEITLKCSINFEQSSFLYLQEMYVF